MNARILTSGFLAVAAWVGVGNVARADHLDQKLLDHAPKIVEALQSGGHHTVGVMRFRVKIGNKAESFGVGPLNGNLATRLENALVINAGSEDNSALGVIHDPSKTALQHKVYNWATDKSEREKLFSINYPMAWGNKQVKPDVLLTGLVEVASDYSKGTITIEEFTAKNTKLTPVIAKFSFDGDVPMLNDLGKSFSVARSLHGKRTAAATRNVIFKEVKKRDDDNTPDKPTNNASTMVGDIEFKLLSAGTSVAIKAGTDNNNKNMSVDCPDASKAVTFSITNKGEKKLGVDLKLNGTSVLMRQDASSEACRVWVLEAGKTYELKGYYEETGDKNVSPFKILTGDAEKEARDAMASLGDKVGTILINVFEEGEIPPPGEDMLISRSLRGAKTKNARSDMHTLQRSLMKHAVVKREVHTVGGKKRDLIVEDTDEAKKIAANLKVDPFQKGSTPVATATIKVNTGAQTNDTPKTEVKPDAKPNDKTNPKPDAKPNDKTNPKPDAKPNDKTNPKPDAKPNDKTGANSTEKPAK